MYISGVSPFRAFAADPVFAWYFFMNSGLRTAYAKYFKNKLRLRHYGGGIVLDVQDANEILKEAILSGKPYMFGRYGSTELNCVTEYLLAKKRIVKSINLKRLEIACFHNGLFPLNEETITRFAGLMLDSSRQVDLYGTFRMIMEDYYIKHYMIEDVILTHLYMMDFWMYKEPFTSALEGKKVLVIHPLADTISSQYKNRKLLFENPCVLPKFELHTLKAVQTVARQRDERFTDWFEALEYMCNAALNINFDVAIIGCGAYGFPLAAKLKQYGKTVIHMGGVTQMLFGIRGARWDVHPQACKLYNEHWVRPDKQDIPEGANGVENGCYW
jgi:hypothetical protein